MNINELQLLAYQSLLNLVSEDGICASGHEEIFGCLFGRDSAISMLKILKAIPKYHNSPTVDTAKLLSICKHTLSSLLSLQGQEVNLESGEEPGKFIHEYRKNNYERLLNLEQPWFVYPDGTLKNYDSIDSTPLMLIALHRYWEVSGDTAFIESNMVAIEKALQWIVMYGDKDGDHLLEYELSSARLHGGLPVQSWTDSYESLRQVNDTFPVYPIAPVEVQGYAWLALKLWGQYLSLPTLNLHAEKIKKAFNQQFIITDQEKFYAAQALDGHKNQIKTITGNPLLLLWASFVQTGQVECVLESDYISDLVARAFMPDMFDPEAGIRTMSTLSSTYNPNQDSYHNGSFWPKLNGMVHNGLAAWGFTHEAAQLRKATLDPLVFFQTPIELYTKNSAGELVEFKAPSGQTSCKTQAWTAAVILDLAAPSV